MKILFYNFTYHFFTYIKNRWLPIGYPEEKKAGSIKT
jgi:hypothetical protein